MTKRKVLLTMLMMAIIGHGQEVQAAGLFDTMKSSVGSWWTNLMRHNPEIVRHGRDILEADPILRRTGQELIRKWDRNGRLIRIGVTAVGAAAAVGTGVAVYRKVTNLQRQKAALEARLSQQEKDTNSAIALGSLFAVKAQAAAKKALAALDEADADHQKEMSELLKAFQEAKGEMNQQIERNRLVVSIANDAIYNLEVTLAENRDLREGLAAAKEENNQFESMRQAYYQQRKLYVEASGRIAELMYDIAELEEELEALRIQHAEPLSATKCVTAAAATTAVAATAAHGAGIAADNRSAEKVYAGNTEKLRSDLLSRIGRLKKEKEELEKKNRELVAKYNSNDLEILKRMKFSLFVAAATGGWLTTLVRGAGK